MNRKICLFIAMSLDGYIAGTEGDISFLDEMSQEDEDYGYTDFIETVDTVILGRKTYDKIVSMGIQSPYGERKVFVLTRTQQPNSGTIEFYSGNLRDLVLALTNHPGKNIYCDGGAETILQLLNEDLIDEMTISVIPILLGEGISLFGSKFPPKKLQLLTSKAYENGLVQLHYRRV